MRSLGDSLEPPSSAALRRGAGAFHSVAKKASFPVALWNDFSRFWSDFDKFSEAEMDAKTDFMEVPFQCFFRMRFCMDFGLFFGGSKPEKSLKTIVFSMVFANFHKIDVFKKSANKPRFWSRFRRPKRRKIEKKWC